MTYFTSDQHFGHFNIIRLCQRPFESVEEMDEVMLAKWNAKVNDSDRVFILGATGSDMIATVNYHSSGSL